MSEFTGRIACRVVGVHRDIVTHTMRITGAFDKKLSVAFDVRDDDEKTILYFAVSAEVRVGNESLFDRLRDVAGVGRGLWLDASWDAKAGTRKLVLRKDTTAAEVWEFGKQGFWARDKNPAKVNAMIADESPRFPSRVRSEQLLPIETDDTFPVSVGVSYDPANLVTRYDGVVEIPADALGKVESVQFVDPSRVSAYPPFVMVPGPAERFEAVPVMLEHDPAATVVALGFDAKAAADKLTAKCLEAIGDPMEKFSKAGASTVALDGGLLKCGALTINQIREKYGRSPLVKAAADIATLEAIDAAQAKAFRNAAIEVEAAQRKAFRDGLYPGIEIKKETATASTGEVKLTPPKDATMRVIDVKVNAGGSIDRERFLKGVKIEGKGAKFDAELELVPCDENGDHIDHIVYGDPAAPKPEGVVNANADIITAGCAFTNLGQYREHRNGMTAEQRKGVVEAIKRQYRGVVRAEEKLVFEPGEFEVKDVVPDNVLRDKNGDPVPCTPEVEAALSQPGAWTHNEMGQFVDISKPDGPGNVWPSWVYLQDNKPRPEHVGPCYVMGADGKPLKKDGKPILRPPVGNLTVTTDDGRELIRVAINTEPPTLTVVNTKHHPDDIAANILDTPEDMLKPNPFAERLVLDGLIRDAKKITGEPKEMEFVIVDDPQAAAIPSSDPAVMKWWDETLGHRKAKPRPNAAEVVPIEVKAIPVPVGANDFAATRKRIEEATKAELEKHRVGKPFDRSDIRRLTRGELAWARAESRKKIEAEFGLPMMVGPRKCAPGECGRPVTELTVISEKLVTVGRTFCLGYNPPALRTLFGCACGRSRLVSIDTRDAPRMDSDDDFDHVGEDAKPRFAPNRLMFGCLPVATRAAVQRNFAAQAIEKKVCSCGRNLYDAMAIDHMEVAERPTPVCDDRRYFRTLKCACGMDNVLWVDLHEIRNEEGDLDGLMGSDGIELYTKNIADAARATIAAAIAAGGTKAADPPEDDEDDEPRPFVVGG